MVKKIHVEEGKPVTLVRTTWKNTVCRVSCLARSDDHVCQDLVLWLADEFYNLITNDQRLRELVIQPVLTVTGSASHRLSLRPVPFTPEGRAPFNEALTLVPGQYRLDFQCLLSPSLAPAHFIEPLTCNFTAVGGA
jgi:hypothetical protein